jgi:murein DD-endopeptidase MepM/ murein hydrolase activator NlpD
MHIVIAVLLLTTTIAGAATPGSSGRVRHAPPPASRAEQASFTWPLEPHEIARPFQAPADAYGPGHRGVDLVGTSGQPVLAAGSGLVLYAAGLVDRGVVSLQHPGGLRTTYEPVTATITAGQQVVRGQEIGVLQAGHPGCAVAGPGACLHWGVRRDDQYLDPLLLVSATRLRLLPWTDRNR